VYLAVLSVERDHHFGRRSSSACAKYAPLLSPPRRPDWEPYSLSCSKPRTLRDACEQGHFRVVHYSIQRTHLHLLVEAAGKDALGRGMKSIGARVARAANRVFGRRGAALHGRYWLRILRTPREVRHALAYVLCNVRKHFRERHRAAAPVRLDPASSSAWFDGWRRKVFAPRLDSPRECEVAVAHTWLLARGWRRHGLIDPGSVPGGSSS
jgi:REP element-mobilizing transposase RayT